jgi:hypothetical protein
MEAWVLDTIRRAKQERWTFLDLGNAGLDELPDELLALESLVSLNLGTDYFDPQTKDFTKSRNRGPRNTLAILPADLSRLSNLTWLCLGDTPCPTSPGSPSAERR